MVSNRKFIFNYFATFWAIIANYIFIPLYLKYLGADWYGVLSLGAIVQSVLVLFDSGITTTLKREFAGSLDKNYKIKLLFSFEKILFALFSIGGLLAVVVLYFLAPHWIQMEASMYSKATLALQLFVGVIVTQIVFFFYNGGLWGEDAQEVSSILKILFSLFRNGFVIFVLMYDSSIISFIIWQIVVSIVFIFIARSMLKKRIYPKAYLLSWYKTFDKKVVKRNIAFAGGMFAISIISVINYQADKILLSSLLPIKILGFYTIGFFLSQSVVTGASPIGHSIFPQLTAAVKNLDIKLSKQLIQEAVRMIMILTIPVAFIIFFHSFKILMIWTNDIEATNAVSFVVPFLVVGSLIQTLQFIPFHVTVAHKYPKPIIVISLLNFLLILPLYYYMITRFGLKGAGITWLIHNLTSTPLFYYFIIKKRYGWQFIRLIAYDVVRIMTVAAVVYFALQSIGLLNISLNNSLIGFGFQLAVMIFVNSLFFLRKRVDTVFSFITSKI